MSTYSIKDLEQLSGIKAHTLRIWEQRYALLSPKRTATNIRYYDNEDLKLILNVALLNENGLKISKIAAMDSRSIREEVLKLTESSPSHSDQIQALTHSMIDMDEERFGKILAFNIDKLGLEQTMFDLIYPFMSKIGVLWQTGAINPAQEHFISNLVRQKLIVAIDGQQLVRGGKKFLLFLPEDELHEISLLFASYMIKSYGFQVVYLGQSTPFDDLLSVYRVHRPDFLLTVITSSQTAEFAQEYTTNLANQFPQAKILVSGFQVLAHDIVLPQNVRKMSDFEEFKGILLENSPETVRE
ncbi:MerR family transcriptional regulator [Algoriphagus jejuensis]|uniref:MerR family transcriptional regulator n=1 Tax=Algoriphagus jejuensis TaxID=419934 RepID=A0ABN1MVL7_9BACT